MTNTKYAVVVLIAMVAMAAFLMGCTGSASDSEKPDPVVGVQMNQIGDRAYVEVTNVGSTTRPFYVGVREIRSDGVIVDEHIVRVASIGPGETAADFAYLKSQSNTAEITNVGTKVGSDFVLVHFVETSKNCTEIATNGNTHTMSCETKVERYV